MHQPDLRLLRYFVAVAEEAHLTRAARRLGIQQPPLSQQIRQLERDLDVALFDRLPRGMALTDAGRSLLTDARTILSQMDQAVRRVRQVSQGERGRLTVGFTASAAFHPFVPATIREFRRQAPEVTLLLEESATSDLIEAVRDERIDVAFVRVPTGGTDGIVLEPLFREEMIAVLPAPHRLALSARRRIGPRLPLAELIDENFVLYRRPSGPALYDAIIGACRAAGFSPKIVQEAPRMLSTLSLVAAGLGVSIVPASIRRLAVEGVAYRSLARSTAILVPLHLAYRERPRASATLRLIAQVRSAASAQSDSLEAA